ncbi:MAG: nucleoside deaminase [Ginsengibacter sp.]
MTDEYYMQQALKQAALAYEADEVPIGAIIVMQNRIIAKAFNQVEKLNDSTAHAEILALTSAFNFLGSKYLPEATLFVTIEPCLMCAGALYWSKIGKVVYGSNDVKHGSLSSNLATNKTPFHPKTQILNGVCGEDCAGLIKQFFKAKR